MQVALLAGAPRRALTSFATNGSTAGVSPTASATNGADSGASATDTGLSSPPTDATRAAASGAPTPDLASTWKPCAPSSQATVACPRQVGRAGEAGRQLAGEQLGRGGAARMRGTISVNMSPCRSTQASTTIIPLGVSSAP